MLKIFQFSQIHKYNYKKNSICLIKKTNFIFEKIPTQTQGRKLTTWAYLNSKEICRINVYVVVLLVFKACLTNDKLMFLT